MSVEQVVEGEGQGTLIAPVDSFHVLSTVAFIIDSVGGLK